MSTTSDQVQGQDGVHNAEVQTGKPPLPDFNPITGEKIDRAHLLRLVNVNRHLYESYVRKHGAAAVIRRLYNQG